MKTQTRNQYRATDLRSVTPASPEAPLHHKTLVVVPTFNEAENIESVLTRIRCEAPWVEIVVIDDSSPDGTAALAQQVADELGQIAVLSGGTKSGLGTAYRTGFAYGLERGHQVLVEMDADLSHDPAALPALLDAVEQGADLAIGSRYIAGASIPHWPARRRALSRVGNAYAAFMLRVPATDLTSGYRAYRADALRAASFQTTRATGYAFQIEMASRVAQAGGAITEVPIVFTDRVHGSSKMSARITVEALLLVTRWGVQHRFAGVDRRDHVRDHEGDHEGGRGR